MNCFINNTHTEAKTKEFHTNPNQFELTTEQSVTVQELKSVLLIIVLISAYCQRIFVADKHFKIILHKK